MLGIIESQDENLNDDDADEVEILLNYRVPHTDIEDYERKYMRAIQTGSARSEIKFKYAWCLVHNKRAYVKKSIPLFEELFKTGNGQMKRDSLFYLALAHTKLRDYCVAKKHLESFLSVEPKNPQARQLLNYIESHLRSDGLKGMAIVGGVAVIGGITAVAIGGIALATGIGASVYKVSKMLRRSD